jgi:hypothetical protein
MFINKEFHIKLEKKMLKIIFLMVLVLAVSMLSLSTIEPSLTTLSVLSIPFTLGDGHTTSILESIQYCPGC